MDLPADSHHRNPHRRALCSSCAAYRYVAAGDGEGRNPSEPLMRVRCINASYGGRVSRKQSVGKGNVSRTVYTCQGHPNARREGRGYGLLDLDPISPCVAVD